MGTSKNESDMNDIEIHEVELHDVDIDAIKHLVKALAALKEANSVTMHGSVSDHCENAAVDIRKALRHAGT